MSATSSVVTYPAAYDLGFSTTVGAEGVLSLDPNDRGNYRSGQVGVGKVEGSKFGISAASYPTLDIPNLTLDTARAIYFTDYWLKARCDALPPRLAVIVFDSAVNNGAGTAIKLLQTSVGTTADGVFGPGTQAHVAAVIGSNSSGGLDGLCAEFLARRTVLMASLSSWASQGLGWARRLCKLPFLTQGLTS